MFNNKIIISFLLVFFVNSCSGLSDAGKVLRNEKIRTTDEFLVKKREPLSLPPDYENLPTPDSKINKTSDKKEINEILSIPEEDSSSNKKKSTVEQSIIDKIRK